MILTDLADALSKSGLKVVEVDGWRTRGHGALYAVDTICCHHTATSKAASGDYPSLGIVRDGRSDLSGPLCNLGLGRSGTVYIVAAGVAYHAGVVKATDLDNWHAIGIEAEADGLSPWPAEQVDAYARLCAALCEHYSLDVSRVMGHKEVCAPAGRKTDPNFDMDAFRTHVATILTAPKEDVVTPEDINAVADLVVTKLLAHKIDAKSGHISIEQAITQAANAPGVVRTEVGKIDGPKGS